MFKDTLVAVIVIYVDGVKHADSFAGMLERTLYDRHGRPHLKILCHICALHFYIDVHTPIATLRAWLQQ